MDQPHLSAGDLLREWRQRRRLSQLQLAVQAEISSRHLSFIETGRAQKPPMNALRLSLHPQGAAPRIANFREWRAHLLAVTRRRIEITGDQVLAELLREVTSYPVPAGKAPPQTLVEEARLAVVHIVIPAGLLSFFSTTTVSRYASRRHARRARNRVVLPGGCRDSRDRASIGGRDDGYTIPADRRRGIITSLFV